MLILFKVLVGQIRRMVGVAVSIAIGKVDPGLVDRSTKCPIMSYKYKTLFTPVLLSPHTNVLQVEDQYRSR